MDRNYEVRQWSSVYEFQGTDSIFRSFFGRDAMSSRLHLIDEQSALDALCGDRKLLSELATIYVEDVPKLLEDLEKAVSSRDFDTACRTMHGLRGLVSAFYSKALTDLTFQLEQELKVGSASSLEKGGLSQLKCSIENLTKELRDAGYAP